jgi:hypothetical protein
MRELSRISPIFVLSDVRAADIVDEAFRDCVRYIADNDVASPLIDEESDNDTIEDESTRRLIRYAVLEIHCGPLRARGDLELGGGGLDDDGDYAELAGYPNVSTAIAVVVASRLATMHELETIYGSEDLEDFVEILSVDAHNRRILSRPREDS